MGVVNIINGRQQLSDREVGTVGRKHILSTLTKSYALLVGHRQPCWLLRILNMVKFVTAS
jgi:hypothetical protein